MPGQQGPDLRDLPIEETGIVEMFVQENVNRAAGANGWRYGFECADCNASTGLAYDSRDRAQEDLDTHLASDHADVRSF